MYRPAAGQGITSDSRPEDISVAVAVHTPVNPTTYHLSTFFAHDSQPPVSATLRTLLASNKTRFRGLELRHRAIDSMYHLLQDSCAKGPTHRKLLNKGNLLSETTGDFQPGSDCVAEILSVETEPATATAPFGPVRPGSGRLIL